MDDLQNLSNINMYSSGSWIRLIAHDKAAIVQEQLSAPPVENSATCKTEEFKG